jgi:hypothetical protein
MTSQTGWVIISAKAGVMSYYHESGFRNEYDGALLWVDHWQAEMMASILRAEGHNCSVSQANA